MFRTNNKLFVLLSFISLLILPHFAETATKVDVTADALLNSGLATTIGSEWTISGSDFGDRKPKVYLEYYKNGKIKNKNFKIIEWSDTQVLCRWTKKIRPGVYEWFIKPKGEKPIQISPDIEIVLPIITSIVPDSGTPKEEITVNGSYFGTKKPKIRLIISGNKKKKVNILSWDMNQIIFKMPKGIYGDCDLEVKNKIGSDIEIFTGDTGDTGGCKYKGYWESDTPIWGNANTNPWFYLSIQIKNSCKLKGIYTVYNCPYGAYNGWCYAYPDAFNLPVSGKINSDTNTGTIKRGDDTNDIIVIEIDGETLTIIINDYEGQDDRSTIYKQ